MSRTLSAAARAALFAPQTGEAFFVLLTITHPNLATPIRVVNNRANVVSGGETFIAFPFTVVLPEETEETPGRARLIICNVDRSIVQALRALESPPSISFVIVLASSPDTIEAGPFNFTLRQAGYDAMTVEGDLELEDFLNETFPADRFVPATFPGLFS